MPSTTDTRRGKRGRRIGPDGPACHRVELRVTTETLDQLNMLVKGTFGRGSRTSVIVALIDGAARRLEGKPSRLRVKYEDVAEQMKRREGRAREKG